MKSLLVVLILIFLQTAHSREITKDINELYRIEAYTCHASQKVEFRAGKKRLTSGYTFRIPVEAGGYAKLHSRKLNLLFEAHFSQGVQFSLKQLDANKSFPYKMKKRTDKKTFVNLEIKGPKRKPVFTLNCKKK